MNLLTVIKRIIKKIENNPVKQVRQNCPYKEQITELLLVRDSKMLGTNLGIHLNYMGFDLTIADSLISHSNILQKEFTSVMYYKFYSKQEAINHLHLEPCSDTALFEEVKNRVLNMFDLYKDYLVSFVKFYQQNPGLAIAYNQYPTGMLSKPFYDYIQENLNTKHITEDQKIIFYFSLINRILSDRYLEINEKQKQVLSESLKTFKYCADEKVKIIARKTKRKVDNYKGVKCPDHLIFIPLFHEEKAESLAKFMLPRYFHSSVKLQALKYALVGRLGIKDKPWMEKLYKLNPYFSKSLKIKNGKKGYVSFIFDYLHRRDKIVTHSLWESLSKARYFVKENGGTISANNFSSQAHEKRKQYTGADNKQMTKELKELVEFLNQLFKR